MQKQLTEKDKRSNRIRWTANVCVVVVFCLLAMRFHHRRQLPQLLMQAVEAQDVEAVRQLLAEGANPNSHDKYHYSVLYRAMYPSNLSHGLRDPQLTEQIMDMLLEAGAKPDCLSSTLSFVSDGLALKMIAKGANVTPDMLIPSVRSGSVRLLQQIGDRTHADVNKRYNGMTPLGWLASEGSSGGEAKQVEVAEWLLAHGADPNIGRLDEKRGPRSKVSLDDGRMPLADAVWLKRRALARLLLEHGARMKDIKASEVRR